MKFLLKKLICFIVLGVLIVLLCACNTNIENKDEHTSSIKKIEDMAYEERETLVKNMALYHYSYENYEARMPLVEQEIKKWNSDNNKIPQYQQKIKEVENNIVEWENIYRCMVTHSENPNSNDGRQYYVTIDEMRELIINETKTNFDLSEMPAGYIKVTDYQSGHDIELIYYHFQGQSMDWAKEKNLTEQKLLQDYKNSIEKAQDISILKSLQEEYNKCVCSYAWSRVERELLSYSPTQDSILNIMEEWKNKYIGNENPTWYNDIIVSIKKLCGVDLAK